MKKFGMKKDQAGDEDDSNRSALFGRRNPKISNGPSKNPYADNAAPPDSYSAGNQSRGYGKPPPSYDDRGQMDQYRQEKTPVPPGGYGGGREAPRERERERAGYGSSGSYGAQRGYGGDQYGDAQPPTRRGGYGGMGRENSRDTMSTDAARNELFGGAAQRHEQRRQQEGYGGGQQSGISGDGGYGSYQDRELTAEEAEEEDINATKDQIRYIKKQDVSSTRNMVRIAQQAEETGRDTLARLGSQGERIHNTEKNLDLASNQNRIAEEKAKELKTLNRSMFAVHVKNPFTAGKRQEEFEQKIMDTHQREREQRDATRSQAYSSQARADQFGREMRGQEQRAPMNRSSAADRAKYQFEADSEDEEMENEIEDNLHIAHQAVGRLKNVATAMGKEVDSQNEHIRRIIGKTDKVDDQIALNRARLDQFK